MILQVCIVMCIILANYSNNWRMLITDSTLNDLLRQNKTLKDRNDELEFFFSNSCHEDRGRTRKRGRRMSRYYSSFNIKYKIWKFLSSSKSVKRRNRMEKKSNTEKSLNFASKRKSSPLYCDVDLTASPRGEKFRKSSPSSSLRNQDSLHFECKEIKDIPWWFVKNKLFFKLCLNILIFSILGIIWKLPRHLTRKAKISKKFKRNNG